MTVAVIIIAAVVLLLIVLASRSNEPYTEDHQPPVYTDDRPRRDRWEKDHFTQKHLHRNDEKHQRHKRNQTPW